jgi:hypothetical protein
MKLTVYDKVLETIRVARGQAPSYNGPELNELLRQMGPQPDYSMLVGLCSDGLPLMLDLSDPTPGSILITGDSGCGKTSLLQAMILSACRLNAPQQAQFLAITPNHSEWSDLADDEHCLGLYTADMRASSQAIIEYTEIGNQRRSGRERGAATILAIDDLWVSQYFMDAKVRRFFEWTVQYGPQNKIWPVVTVETDREYDVRRLIQGFGTRIQGRAENWDLGTGCFVTWYGQEQIQLQAAKI